MNIYTPDHDNELIISLKEWCRNNPIDIKGLGQEPIPAWNRGISPSDETRLLCGLAAKRKVMTDKMRENYRQSKLGEKNPNYGGKLWTPEARKKLSETNTGVKRPAISEWHRNNPNHTKMLVVCPHCDKKGKNFIMQRWHFDRCKYKS